MTKNQARNKKMSSFHYPQCSEPNQRIHMDLLAPKNIRKWKKFIMCVTDAFSKFAKLIAIPDKCAETIAEALFTRKLCRLEIVSVKETEFCNEVVDKLLLLLKKHLITLRLMPKWRWKTKQLPSI
jgi:hypothetical protein